MSCEKPRKAPEKFEMIENICLNNVSTVAIKTIRFLNLTTLDPLFSEQSLDPLYPSIVPNFRVIVVVRDPRSTYHSRKVLYLDKQFNDEIQRLNGTFEWTVQSGPLYKNMKYALKVRTHTRKMINECEQQAETYSYYEQAPPEIRRQIMFVRYEVKCNPFDQFMYGLT